MKNRRRLWIVLATVCTILICAGLCAGLILHRESELDDIQNEALEELREHRGEYDEKSIVLYDTNRGEAQALAEKFGAKLRISFDGKFATLTLPGDVTVEDIYSARGNRKYISDMALDYQVKTSELTESEEEGNGERLPTRPQYSVSDEDYELQGYLDYLNIKNVWDWTTGYNVTVAVIDTGIDTDHPEFAGRISEYSYNATEDKIVKDYVLSDGSYDWSLVEDEQGHGTAVTGVIAASMNDGKVVGIAPNVTIITIKAECDENGRFARTSDLVFGLYYAIERDVDVVNMSFGVQSLVNPFAEATQLALDSDVICIAAAGNEGSASLSYPAAAPNVFGVGALEADDWNLASYSNYGENVNLVAPGTTYTTLMGGAYGTMNGTSLASPVVTGAIALYLSVNYYQEFLTVEEVLYASCYDLGDLGCDYYYGYGALDISALIMEERGTVTFNMMTDELENTEQLFIRDHTLQNMPEPERLYAIFDGWYYDPCGTEEYNWYTDKFSTDLTLYAKWVNEEDGIPFTYVELDDGTIEIRSYTGHRRYITIPDMIDGKIVSSVGEEAFKGETRLREVILPKALKRIRRSAFEGCNNLVHIDIPDAVTEIGDKAFYNNVRLSYVGVGGNSRLASIGNFAFSNCAKLQRFELPAGLVSVNGSAFFGDINLTSFTVRAGNKNFTARDGVLFNYTQSTLVAYPAGLRGEYTIPANVIAIGNYAFGYARFDGINLGSIQCIGNYAFANSELESIVIPNTVTAMGESAFASNFYLRNVQLGNSLTAVSSRAFYYCTALQKIEIPANIREIKEGAFANTLGMTSVMFAPNSKLTSIGADAFASSSFSSVAIPASVISIGDGAFAQRMGAPLTSVTFAEKSQLRIIGKQAFSDTFRLQSINLPAQLESIGTFAFINSGLKEVTIPASVTSFGAGAFAACHSLTAINVEEVNAVYVDVDGVVYDKAKTTLVEYPAGNARSDYSILNTVTAIEEDAFYGSWNLYTVYLPESLQEIRREAFFDCKGLGYMQIPDNVIQISNLAFAQCWNLRNIYLNDTSKLPRISYQAFAYCGIYSFCIPANVSTMAQGAFEGCANLTSFTFAANSKLESISAYMFDGCDNLQSITFEKGSALTSIQAHGFEGMRKLTSVDFGDAEITNIDNFAFRFCESLTRVGIPEGTTYVGRYAFYYCTSLNEVSIPASVEFIGRFAFLGTQNLNVYFASETLPAYLQEDWDYGMAGYYLGVTNVITDGEWKYAKLTSGDIAIIQYNGAETNINLTALNFGGDIVNIGGKAFAYSTVENIVLPETLVNIQNEAFYHSNLKSVTIPANIDFIGRSAFADTPIQTLAFANNSKLRVMEQSAFEGTESLASVTLPKSLTTIGRAIFKNSGITSLTFENGIGITEISEEAFAYTNITTVTIPDSVTLLNHSAFRETKQLKSVNFGNSEGMMIMSNVFYHSGLESVHIPTNVTYIGEYAFVALTNLQSFTVAEDHPQYRAIDGLLVSKDGRKLIAAPAGREGIFTVPAGIEVIGFGAFEESKLTKIDFLADANILSFGYRAFYGSAITEMHVPASVVAIDYYAFATCENLTKVTFAEDNQLRGIYEGAFYACPNLYDITLPDTIVEISDFAFYGCKKIDKLPVSETSTIKGIYDYAFAYAGLEGAFTTPETLIDIGAHAFMGNKFTSVTVPDTNAYDLVIGIGAFEGCNNLQEITLPFIGASFEDPDYTWFGYIFGAGGYKANSTYVPESLKKVTITEGISFVGTGAFWCIDTIEEIDVPYSVTMVCYGAFDVTRAKYELTNTITIDGDKTLDAGYEGRSFGDGISGFLKLARDVKLAQNAFTGGALNSVILPEGITTIPAYSFWDSNITSIVIPESVTNIEANAFSNCGSLYVIYNYSNLDLEIGSTEHGEIAYNAKMIVNKDGTREYREGISDFEIVDTEDGFRFIRENGSYKLISYFGPEGTITLPLTINGNKYDIHHMKGVVNVIIPEGMTSINDVAFAGSGLLRSVKIPSTVTSIGNRAFDGCSELIGIVIPEGVTSIGGDAFSNCGKLEYALIPDTVCHIGGSAFGGCVNLQSIRLPSQLEEINNATFFLCPNLTECLIPEGVKRISSQAFQNCTKLTDISLPSTIEYIAQGAFSRSGVSVLEVAKDNPFFTIIDGVLYNKTVTSIVFVPDSVENIEIPATVQNIADAFLQCDSLRTVTFQEGTTIASIGQCAFADCTNLESIVIPDSVESIQWGAFAGCEKLEEIIIPNSVKFIGDIAFQNCSDLEEITLPEGIITIGERMFSNCSNLISITLPSTIESIGVDAFEGCRNLLDIHLISNDNYVFEGGILYDSAFTQIIAVANGISGHISIKEGIANIPYGVFVCSNMSSVTLPSTLTSIETWAFGWDVTIYEIYNNSDIELSFGSDDNGCVAYSTTLIVDRNGNKHYRDSTNNQEFVDTPDGFRFIKQNDQYTLVRYLGTEDTVTLPLEINGKDYNIYKMRGVKNVVIPDGFTHIDERAFEACHTLVSISIPNSVTRIGSYAFYWCTNLASIRIPNGVEHIESETFAYCYKLVSVSIPDSVKSISDWVFTLSAYYTDPNNWENGTLYIDNHLIKVSEDAEHFEVRPGTKSIAQDAFKDCYKLKHLTIGGEHNYVLGNAFFKVTNLETLVITEMPAHIVDYFGWGENVPITLKNIVLADGVRMNSEAFYDWAGNPITGVTIYVEANEKDVRWDENFPGWNAGNRVVYGDGWINATFYDPDGNLVSSEIFTTSQVIRLPQILLPEAEEGYVFVVDSWDLDGDGIADTVPATSTIDINAHPILKKEQKTYKIVFYAEDGKTVIASFNLAHGAAITPPEVAEKQGYTTNGWVGYYEGLTATRNAEFILNRSHIGGDHTYGEPVWVAPTCTEKGYNKHTCTVCGEWYATDEVEPLGHSYTETRQEPDCLTDGYVIYHCNTCGDEHTEVLPAAGHAYISKVIKDSTCTKLGQMQFTCTECGDKQTESIALKAHNYQKKYASKWWLQWLIEHILNIFFGYEGDNPYYFECADCGHIQTAAEQVGSGSASVKDVCDHNLSEWTKINDASCIGYATEGRICAVCNQVIEARTSGELGEHTPAEAVIENLIDATCTTDGSYDSVTYCSVCQAEIGRETRCIEKLGHNEISHSGKSATCTTFGWKEYITCSRCDYSTYELIEALGHDEIHHTGKTTTCTEIGWEEYVTCSRCDYSTYKGLPATGHKASEWIIDEEATYEKDGRKHKECTVCGDILEESIVPMLSHTYVSVVTPPTCTEQGYTTHTCSDCGNSYVDDYTPAAGHTFGNWQQTKAPTCTKKGVERRECASCDHFEEKEISALGHNYTSIVTPPTCTEKGYTTHGCTRCNEGKYVDSYVDTLNHSFTNYVSNNDAIYTEDGTKTAKCDHCSKTDTVTDVGSALGMAQKFRDEMAELNTNGNTESTYMELYAILQTYSTLSAEEKAEVATEFATLQQMINAYNAKAQTANNELAEATEIAFAPIAATSFAFLAALWFVLRKKFLV